MFSYGLTSKVSTSINAVEIKKKVVLICEITGMYKQKSKQKKNFS